jgi:hypothetical protein
MTSGGVAQEPHTRPSPAQGEGASDAGDPSAGAQAASAPLDPGDDPAYPTHTAADPVYPCQTLDVLAPVFDGVATPAIWSRLADPLGRALAELWGLVGLSSRGRPERWVGLHLGRIAVNAHGWERMRAAASDSTPDPALVEPPAPGLSSWWERQQVRWSKRGLVSRLAAAEHDGHDLLSKLSELRVTELDTAELARGPLDARAWRELLMPALGLQLIGEEQEEGAAGLLSATGGAFGRNRAGIALERRFSTEVGRRLTRLDVLDAAADVAYLTLEERIRAVHDTSPYWRRLVETRARRIDEFVEVELPRTFWGRPRIQSDAIEREAEQAVPAELEMESR